MIYISDTGIISLKGNILTWNIYKFFSLSLHKFCEITSKQFTYCGIRYTLYIWPRGRKGSLRKTGSDYAFINMMHKELAILYNSVSTRLLEISRPAQFSAPSITSSGKKNLWNGPISGHLEIK